MLDQSSTVRICTFSLSERISESIQALSVKSDLFSCAANDTIYDTDRLMRGYPTFGGRGTGYPFCVANHYSPGI